ncbi:MAG: hypothetical protein AAGF20_12845 [Pseudomonadota bacterium]
MTKHLLKATISGISAMALVPFAAATDLSVGISDALQEKLEDDYGLREGPKLIEEVTEDLEREFARRSVNPARVDITIIDAKPNRPTFSQLTDRPGLDPIRSISLGGMKLKGIAYDESGTVIGEREYRWYENDIRQVIGQSTWGDARRASSRFASRFAKDLAQ